MAISPACLKGKTIYTANNVWKHLVSRVNKHKIVFNRDNDKRHVQVDGITTLANANLGHE